jgi:hypothetical protein
MNRLAASITAVVLAGGCTRTPAEIQIVDDAAAAPGDRMLVRADFSNVNGCGTREAKEAGVVSIGPEIVYSLYVALTVPSRRATSISSG